MHFNFRNELVNKMHGFVWAAGQNECFPVVYAYLKKGGDLSIDVFVLHTEKGYRRN